MRVLTPDRFAIPLAPGHRFPARKYGLLRARVLGEGILRADEVIDAPLIAPDDLTLAHDPAYVRAMETGTVDPRAMRRIGLPWSAALVARSKATVGGAVAAVSFALQDGFSGQLAGGTHHAHRDFGAGFCVFNDHAVAALKAVREGWVSRVAIVDLDVHQGDGNASILADEPDVFVLSVHGEKNFPFRKVASDLDIGLADGTGDDGYLAALEEGLAAVFAFAPDLVLYQAGVDALEVDRLGRLALTHDGLMRRDRMVLGACKARGIPVALGIGGGYAEPIEETVTAYANSWRVARDVFGI